MEKAKELLEQTALKNYEIAEKVGFSDPHYFGISFKKMTGKTPTEYAREKKIHMKRKVLTAAGICIGILILTEGSRYFVQNQKCQKQLFAMDTYMEFTAYGKNSEKAVDAAIEEVQKLDAMLSAENSKSEVYALNEQGNLQATDDLAELILRGKEIYQETDGLF